MHSRIAPDKLWATAAYYLYNQGEVIATERWQGMDNRLKMLEFTHFYFMMPMKSLEQLYHDFGKHISFPWVRLHLDERLSGKPLNPGTSYRSWPYYGRDKEMRSESNKFSHTYMERYWPKHANDHPEVLGGIRYEYGDLNDVIALLKRDPGTRQAYLPVWFPEDTGAVHQGRVPCTIGYHFLIRNGRIDVTYHIRSCDIFRHFIDDVYLTVGLVEAIRFELCTVLGNTIDLGNLYMNIGSLHCFEIEKPKLMKP